MRRTNIWTSTLLTLLGVLLCGTVVSAQTIIVPHTYRGDINAEGANYGINPAHANYFIGEYRDPRGHECYPYCSADWRNYFVFDMSSIEQQIIAASFEIYASGSGSSGPQSGAGYYSPDPSENFELHDVNTPAAELIDIYGSEAARKVMHTDLGSGIVYGNRDMTAADCGNIVSIELNS